MGDPSTNLYQIDPSFQLGHHQQIPDQVELVLDHIIFLKDPNLLVIILENQHLYQIGPRTIHKDLIQFLRDLLRVNRGLQCLPLENQLTPKDQISQIYNVLLLKGYQVHRDDQAYQIKEENLFPHGRQ